MTQVVNVLTEANLELTCPCRQQGKHSKTYFGRDTQLNAPIFVKIINKSSLSANYFQEAQALYATEHPNILKIKCATQDADNVYLVMDICPNGSLQNLYSSQPLTVRNILKIAHDFLSGLHFVHTKQLIHFDVKPSNILLNKNGTAVLADFGLAQRVDNYGFALSPPLYNKHFPPEFLTSTSLTSLSDIYQAGVTIYRMCNGDSILNNQISQHKDIFEAIKNGKFPDRNFYLPHIPKRMRRAINKAMTPNPNNRFQSVLDFHNYLATIEDNLDWQYDSLENNQWKWTKQNSTHSICFETISNGSTFDSYGYKTNLSNGQKRNSTPFCRKGISSTQWLTYCTDALERM